MQVPELIRPTGNPINRKSNSYCIPLLAGIHLNFDIVQYTVENGLIFSTLHYNLPIKNVNACIVKFSILKKKNSKYFFYYCKHILKCKLFMYPLSARLVFL